MLRYAITDGSRFADSATARREGLLADARRWAGEGVDFVQLREKALPAGELVALAAAMADVFAAAGSHTRLLINGRADIAAAAGAAGVHLTARPGELNPAQVRQVFATAGMSRALVSVSCHTLADVTGARDEGADLMLFGPVFEKRLAGEVVVAGLGLEVLRAAYATALGVRVFALGGVTPANAPACLEAGAAGVAAIRLFALPAEQRACAVLVRGLKPAAPPRATNVPNLEPIRLAVAPTAPSPPARSAPPRPSSSSPAAADPAPE